MSKEKLNHKSQKLSIQLSSDGFSFCVYNTNTKKYESITELPFTSNISSPNRMLEEVKNTFKNNILLHNTYDEVVFIHHNELSTFVPQSYFDQSLLSNYLQNTVKVLDNDFISYDELPLIKANNVYIPFVNINNYIFDSFGTFTFLHSSTVFLNNILKTNDITFKRMFVNVYKNNFQLLVIENNQLILSNCFDYQTEQDFVYYVLFVAEQLDMDPNLFILTLYGNIKETDKTYQLLYHYVRNVSIFATLNPSLGPDISCLPQAHFNLLQLHT